MPKLTWDQAGDRKYETGVDRGVLFVQGSDGTYGDGVAWNGLTGVTETPSGAEETKLWADNIKYLSMRSAEEFGGTIEAYTYPDEWQACDGSASIVTGVHVGQQGRRPFGLAYRTIVGNDTDMDDHGYKLHLVYGATVSPSERAYATVNDSPEAITFSWEFTTTPVDIPSTVGDFKPTAIITIDTTELEGGKENANLVALEKILYGDDSTEWYSEATDVTATNWSTKKSSLYEKNGSTYTATDDTDFSESTTYYYKHTGLVSKLPSPAEVYTQFSA